MQYQEKMEFGKIGEKRVIKYGHKFNDLSVSHLNSIEIDFFIALMTQVQNERDNLVRVYLGELKEVLNFSDKRGDLKGNRASILLENLSDKFNKINFIEREDNDLSFSKITKPIFSVLKIYVDKKNVNNSFFEFKLSQDNLNLVNNLSSKYVLIDLIEFSKIRNKNSKILYKILKQFKKTGKVILSIEKVKMLFGVNNMATKEITRNCIKKPIQDLKFYFDDLSFEKYIQNRKINKYVITFKPEVKKAMYKKRPTFKKEILKDWSLEKNKSTVSNQNVNKLLNEIN